VTNALNHLLQKKKKKNDQSGKSVMGMFAIHYKKTKHAHVRHDWDPRQESTRLFQLLDVRQRPTGPGCKYQTLHDPTLV
jgi:hypothetical protein